MLKHKSLFFTVLLVIVISGMSITAFANELPVTYDYNIVDNGSEITARSEELSALNEPEGMVTRHKDGTVNVSYLTDEKIAEIRTESADVSAYIPPSVNAEVSAVSAVSAASDDPYGRTQMNPAEVRIGQLVCAFNNDSDSEPDVTFVGTGCLQHYDVVVSAAHCVWKPQYEQYSGDGWAQDITFYAGKSGTSTYRDSAGHITMNIATNFINNSTYTLNSNGEYVANYAFEWDWSIIQLDDNLGDTCGWLGLRPNSQVQTGLNIEVTGYPGDKSSGTQWKSTGSILSLNGNRLYYSAYIYPGNSGGPVLDSGGLMCGIATSYSTNASGAWIQSGGTRIYDTLYNYIVEARTASKARWE